MDTHSNLHSSTIQCKNENIVDGIESQSRVYIVHVYLSMAVVEMECNGMNENVAC